MQLTNARAAERLVTPLQ